MLSLPALVELSDSSPFDSVRPVVITPWVGAGILPKPFR